MLNIPYGRQHITQEDVEAVVRTLQSAYLTQGPTIKAFEDAFAKYVGARYAVAVTNGTAALHLCALALEVEPGTKVITTPITFAASANCVRYCGGQVIFADVEPDTAILDIEKVRILLESHPKGTFSGIIPVDFAGYAVDLASFRELADEYGLWMIEDACHAPGGYFTDGKGKQQSCGNGQYADLSIFSFHPVKHIATGEGGMITTNRKDLYEKLLQLRTHGITKDPTQLQENHGGWYYEMQSLGYNYRISDINCALGLSQLSRAANGLKKRRAIAQRYDEAFQGSPIRPLVKPMDGGHAYHLYVIQTEERKSLYDYLRSQGIYTQVHYIPVHLQPYYQNLGWRKGDLPQAEKYYDQCLSLPMYPELAPEQQEQIIELTKTSILCEL